MIDFPNANYKMHLNKRLIVSISTYTYICNHPVPHHQLHHCNALPTPVLTTSTFGSHRRLAVNNNTPLTHLTQKYHKGYHLVSINTKLRHSAEPGSIRFPIPWMNNTRHHASKTVIVQKRNTPPNTRPRIGHGTIRRSAKVYDGLTRHEMGCVMHPMRRGDGGNSTRTGTCMLRHIKDRDPNHQPKINTNENKRNASTGNLTVPHTRQCWFGQSDN